MYPAARYYLIFSMVFLLRITAHTYGDENAKSDFRENNALSDIKSENFIFLPRLGLQIQGRTFPENDAGHRTETNRVFDLDLLKIKNIVFSFFLNEFLIYDDKGSNHIKPKSIYYEMDYGNIKWESGHGILTCFFDHTCSNIINDNQTEGRVLRWYGYGIRWESYGMRPGRRDTKINSDNLNIFDLINNLNYRISAEKSVHTNDFEYKYIMTGALRYDILRYYFFIPYLEGSITALIDDRVKYNLYSETGIRVHSAKGDITPFIGTNKINETAGNNGRKTDLYYIGLRMETLLQDENETESAGSKGMSFFPDFHLSGSYGKYVDNENLNFNADILIGIGFFSSYVISPFIGNRLIHNSLQESSGMFPRYIQSNTEAGISCKIDIINALFEPYYTYTRYDEGDSFKGYTVKYHTTGLRICSREMKTGFANNDIDFNKTSGFEWINRIDWLISASRVIREYYYDYIWEYNIMLRWNIFRYKKSIPYISADISLLTDKNYDKIYHLESGVRTQNGLYWMLFYRFEYRTAEDPGDGLYGSYHLIGVRFEI